MEDVKRQRNEMEEQLRRAVEDRENLTKEVEKIIAEQE